MPSLTWRNPGGGRGSLAARPTGRSAGALGAEATGEGSLAETTGGDSGVAAAPVRVLDAHEGDVVIEDPDWSRRVLVTKEGSASTVVWNPGAAKGAAQADVGKYWAGFVCVEAGNIGDRTVTIPPGGTHTLSQALKLV